MCMSLFENPVKERKVRNGIIAYQYKNGTIVINGQKYVCYSITSAIAKFRKDYPFKK